MTTPHSAAATQDPRQGDTVFISDADVAALHDWPTAVAALSQAYASPVTPAMVPPRVMARGQGFWLRGLCAVSPSGETMGCKLIAASPRIKRASYLISLFDQNTMELAALVDGNRITDIRTAATSAVAVDALAVRRPLKVGVLGSSTLARNTLLALASVRELSSVRVFSPTPASRERFAEEFKAALGIDVAAVELPEIAVRGADVVLCAARSRDESPVLLGRWLEPGTVVVSVGSTLPEQREVDVDTLARAALIVADMVEEVVHDTGDAIAAVQAGVDVAGKTVSLHAVKAGQHAGRCGEADIVLYKSVGSALQDVVTAEMLLHQARLTRRCAPMAQRIVTITR